MEKGLVHWFKENAFSSDHINNNNCTVHVHSPKCRPDLQFKFKVKFKVNLFLLCVTSC